ncbi:unnamed protein product [Discula destructiva]
MADSPAIDATSDAGDVLAPSFVIGIAGASSSGKTVLSLLLADIFEKAIAKPGIATASVKIISQDDYFLPQNECPRRTFRPRISDERVANGHIDDDSRIETADRDCLSAFDWVRLHNDIQAFINGDPASSAVSVTADKSLTAHKVEVAEYRQNLASKLAPVESNRLVKEVREFISDQIMFNMHDNYSGKLFKDDGENGDLLNVRLLIVEGFLLYSREKLPKPNNVKTPLSPQKYHAQQQRQAQQLQQLQQPSPLPQPLAGSPKACHEAISDLLDMRLYLQITPEQSFRRRFGRTAYMDPPRGTREPGEMWKTVGYFFDIVRANFYGYDMLPISSVSQVLQGNAVTRNAVRKILLQMRLAEQTARNRCLADRAALKEWSEDQAVLAAFMAEMNLDFPAEEAK